MTNDRPAEMGKRVAMLAVVWLMALASPASADAAQPSNARSVVTGVVPESASIRPQVTGGDSFFRLQVDGGHDVVVLGYEDEPYLHFQADGTVLENQHSPAAYLNRTRFAGTPTPAAASATAAPLWQQVASGGDFAWHDHRVHWMARNAPPAPQSWTVSLIVDGAPVSVQGRLTPVAAPSALPWLVAAAVMTALLVAVGLQSVAWVAALVITAAAVTLPIAVALVQLPITARRDQVDFGLVVLGALLAGVALARSRAWFAGALLAGGGFALALWGYQHLAVLNHGVLVTTLPALHERAATCVALAVGSAGVITGITAVLRPAAATLPSAS